MSGLGQCKQQVTELLTRRDLYQPKESTHHLHVIDNYVDHLNLDNTFLHGSPDWKARQDPAKLRQFVRDATAAVDNANGTMNRLNMTVSEASGIADNQLRQYTSGSNQVLHDARQNLHPQASQSRERIQQFSDLLGVTDRFNGYRHNMSRNRQNFKLDTQWARESLPEPRGNYFANELLSPRNNERFNLPASSAHAGSSAHCEHGSATTRQTPELQSRDMSVESRDWRTDYTVGFAPKVKPPYGKPFPLNPTQDFTKTTRGRPLAAQSYQQRVSEYADRYISPRDQLDTHHLSKRSS